MQTQHSDYQHITTSICPEKGIPLQHTQYKYSVYRHYYFFKLQDLMDQATLNSGEMTAH